MALRYLLDENLRGPLWAALVRANARLAHPLEITCVGEDVDLPLTMGDPELLLWAEQHGFVMISNDARTMPRHFASPHRCRPSFSRRVLDRITWGHPADPRSFILLR